MKVPRFVHQVDEAYRATGRDPLIKDGHLNWPPPNWGDPGRNAAPHIIWETEKTGSLVTPTTIEDLDGDLVAPEEREEMPDNIPDEPRDQTGDSGRAGSGRVE